MPEQVQPSDARSDLEITFGQGWEELEAGQADMMVLTGWSTGLPLRGALQLSSWKKEEAEANPNIQIAQIDGNDIVEFDLNNNYTIPAYPGVRSPTNALRVRQAIARLVDKDWIIAIIKEFLGDRIDQPIPARQSAGWCNASVVGANYPYPYNPQEAANLLAAEGFSDTDSNGWLNYPPDWDGAPGADTTTYPLVVCVRSDIGEELAAGQYLINQVEMTLAATRIGAGFKTTGAQWQQPRAVLSPKVIGNRDYNVYTGDWVVKRYPIYLFKLFHSQFWYPNGPNYVTGFDKFGNPNYPDADAAVEGIWYAPDIPAAKTACGTFCGLHADYCINIPLWSTASYVAWRKDLVAVVNMDGYGLVNDYTFLNAYKVGGGPIRVAVPFGQNQLNVLYSQWIYEHIFLDRIYPSSMNVEPYKLDTEVPWVVQDWEAGKWVDPQDDLEKTVVTYYIRKDVGIVAPVTGCVVRDFDVHDFEFTIWYNYAFKDSWQFSSVMDIKYTKIVDVNGDGWAEFQVFFDDSSYWFSTTVGLQLSLLPKQELLGPLCGMSTESWTQADLDQHDVANNVVQVVTCTLNGELLDEGTDYMIRAGYDMTMHNGFVPLVPLNGEISITYWYPDIPANGFHLGNLPWNQFMYSLGTHYPVSITDNTIILRKNPAFFLDLPLLGEIDWSWKWAAGPKPRSGNYKIEIFDVVKCTAAYCTRGDGQFNPKYFPGADTDPTDLCHIGIFDLVSITSQYGKKFGTPPYSSHPYVVNLPLPKSVNLQTTPDQQGNLGGYFWGFAESSKSSALTYTWSSAAKTVTINTGNNGDYLNGYYYTIADKLEEFHITIDP
jgi:hypothetical protein